MKLFVFFLTFTVNAIVSVTCAVKVISVGSNRCLDVQNGSKAVGTTIQIFDCNGTPAQLFEFNPVDHTLRVYGFTMCLDVDSFENGAPVRLQKCFMRQNRSNIWLMNDAGDIVNSGSGRCLDVKQPADRNGAILQLWDCAGTSNQKWVQGV